MSKNTDSSVSKFQAETPCLPKPQNCGAQGVCPVHPDACSGTEHDQYFILLKCLCKYVYSLYYALRRNI